MTVCDIKAVGPGFGLIGKVVFLELYKKSVN